MLLYVSGKNCRRGYLHYLRRIKKYIFEKRPMLYNGIFGCHGNICYVILSNAFLHSIGLVNVCTNFEINRYKIGENMQKSYVVFDVT